MKGQLADKPDNNQNGSHQRYVVFLAQYQPLHLITFKKYFLLNLVGLVQFRQHGVDSFIALTDIIRYRIVVCYFT